MNTATGLLEPPLTAQPVEQYRRDGFIITRGIFTNKEVAELDTEANRLMQRAELIDPDNIRCRWQNCAATGECRFDCFDPVLDIGPTCARIARDPRMMEIVSALYEVRASHRFLRAAFVRPRGRFVGARGGNHSGSHSFPGKASGIDPTKHLKMEWPRIFSP
jgi:hypothetical protein